MTDQEYEILEMMTYTFTEAEVCDLALLSDTLDYAIKIDAPFEIIVAIRDTYNQFLDIINDN